MGLNPPFAGAGAAAEYLVPGVPWVTASTVNAAAAKEHELPTVCSSVHVRCTSGSAGVLLFGFTAAGVLGTHRVSLAPGTSETFNVRSRTLAVGGQGATATYELLAGLTLISAREYPKYSGSQPGTPQEGV